jgi:hypothetical protein
LLAFYDRAIRCFSELSKDKKKFIRFDDCRRQQVLTSVEIYKFGSLSAHGFSVMKKATPRGMALGKPLLSSIQFKLSRWFVLNQVVTDWSFETGQDFFKNPSDFIFSIMTSAISFTA